jgi:hypothetical protein
MSLRVQKTLGVLIRGAVALAGLAALDFFAGFGSPMAFEIWAVLYVVAAGCTWWLNGTSRIAVAWQDRAEARRRQQVS